MVSKTFEVKQPRSIKPVANGTYTGKIIDVKYRDQPYSYADLVIDVDGLPEATIEASFPAKEITPTNSFGKFIGQWQPVGIGQPIDPAVVLVGKEVEFMVMNTPGKSDPSSMYPNVVKGSLFPKGKGGSQAAAGTPAPAAPAQ